MAQVQVQRDKHFDTEALISELLHPDEEFTTAILRDRTEVPKNEVRALLASEPNVQIRKVKGKYHYQSVARESD